MLVFLTQYQMFWYEPLTIQAKDREQIYTSFKNIPVVKLILEKIDQGEESAKDNSFTLQKLVNLYHLLDIIIEEVSKIVNSMINF